MAGFGIELGDPNRWGDEDDPRIVGNDVTEGNPEGGRKAMENLLAINPDINVVYSINEPAASGAWEAMKAIGMNPDDVIITGVDGGCPGVKDVEAGIIDATSQQYPLLMAKLGVEAIKVFRGDRRKARADRRQEFLRHRCGADHRQAGRWRALDQRGRRSGALLGLIAQVPKSMYAMRRGGSRPAPLLELSTGYVRRGPMATDTDTFERRTQGQDPKNRSPNSKRTKRASLGSCTQTLHKYPFLVPLIVMIAGGIVFGLLNPNFYRVNTL